MGDIRGGDAVTEEDVVPCGPGTLASATGRSGGRVPAPAPDLPPQSFGRNDTWQLWVVFCAFIALLVEGVMVLRWAFVLDGRFELGDFLVPLAVYGVVATWLNKLTAEGAASLLAGIRRSSQAELLDLDSPATQAAVAALEVIAQGK